MILKLFLPLLILLAVSTSLQYPESTQLNNKTPWEINKHVYFDETGNLISNTDVKNVGEKHDIYADWTEVVNGKKTGIEPAWRVGGIFRWKRSADADDYEESRVKRSPEHKEPWELNPNVARDENGNVVAGATIKRTGEKHDVEAGWSKVVRGPNRAKPTWNVGGTFRWRRSADEQEDEYEESRVKRSPEHKEPWELNPNVARDENGNVVAGATIKRTGEKHDVEAGWSKVVRGPNRAKPTWNVGGTFRWRRSADEQEDEYEESRVKRSPEHKEPWELNPNVARDENGNVVAGATIKRTGEKHDVEAGWSKVVRGPNRAKPTWNVGGTFRWRRSADEQEDEYEESRVKRSPEHKEPWELNPNVARDENGNVVAGATIKRTGEKHDVEAGWSKVVRGPNRAKPTWHVGGTIRW